MIATSARPNTRGAKVSEASGIIGREKRIEAVTAHLQEHARQDHHDPAVGAST